MAITGTIQVQNEPLNTRMLVDSFRPTVVRNVLSPPVRMSVTNRPRWVREPAGRSRSSPVAMASTPTVASPA